MVFGRYDLASFTCFAAYAGCSVIVPVVLVEVAQSLGFPLAEGGTDAGGAIQLGRSIPMVISMLFCGFAAGWWGKLRVLGVAMIFMACGILAAAWVPNYALLFLAVAFAGLGEGVVEGLATPVVQDIHPDEPGRYINFTHAFWSVGVVLTVLLAGWMLQEKISWRFILSCCGILALIPALLFLLPYHGPQKINREAERMDFRTVWNNAVHLMKIPRFWLFFVAMFLAGGGEFCLTFWVASFIRLDYAGSAWMGGLGSAFFAGGMIVGRMGFGFLVRQQYLKHLIVGTALGGTLLGIFPPLLNSLAGLFALLFFLGICTGPFWPSVQSYCVDRVKGDSTMIFILLSCAGVPGCGVFAWLMGVAGKWYGLRPSFFLVPICYFLLACLIACDWFVSNRERWRR